MARILFAFIAFTLATIQAFGQAVLTKEANAMRASDRMTYMQIEACAPGGAGRGQLWDFSDVPCQKTTNRLLPEKMEILDDVVNDSIKRAVPPPKNSKTHEGTDIFHYDITSSGKMVDIAYTCESGKLSGYTFWYDDQNRLVSSRYGEGEGMSENAGRYDETVEYDLNGNVTALERHGMIDDGNYGVTDRLRVTLSGNQPLSVTDEAEVSVAAGSVGFNAPGGKSEYRHNGFGALTGDTGRGITAIDYDNWHNPLRIQFANGNVTRYVYSAEGEKLRTVHCTAMPDITVADGERHELTAAETLAADSTDYLLGGSLVMRNGRIDKWLFDGGFFKAYVPTVCIMPPPAPSWMHDGSTPTEQQIADYEEKIREYRNEVEKAKAIDAFNVYYYNSDHLGNIREVVDERGNVCQSVDYYPFGTPFIRASATGTDLQPYKYNGKELDMTHGLDTYDYGARQLWPVLPVWDRIDPLCEKYAYVSPYCYCLDNPVNYIDPDGQKVRPRGLMELLMIRNTLPKDSWNYVQFDKKGFVDKSLLSLYHGNSLNYNNLKQLVNSKYVVDVILDDEYDYLNMYGQISKSPKMNYLPYIYGESFPKDVKGDTPNGLTTGESGFMGKTLFPDRIGSENSTSSNIKVIINKNLSSAGAAEIYSHEVNGHALLYIMNGGDHIGASHQVQKNEDSNRKLIDMIVKSKKETIYNMKCK